MIDRIAENNDKIIDIGENNSRSPRRAVDDLYQHYRFSAHTNPPSNASTAILTVLKVVRNNLFHGEKLYTGESDMELLEIVSTILENIVIDSAREYMDIELSNTLTANY